MRSVWSGTLGFGLASLPVQLLNLVGKDESAELHQVRKSDGSRIRYKKVAEADGEPVEQADIASGFELPTGQMVLVTPEDKERAFGENSKNAQILAFTGDLGIPRAAHEATYVIAPQKNAEHAYELLAKTMARLGRSAVVELSLRGPRAFWLLTSKDGYLYLERLAWAAQVREPNFTAPDTGVTEAELGMAAKLVEALSADWDWKAEENKGAAALTAVIQGKAETGQVVGTPVTRPAGTVTQPQDLMTVLAASVEKAKADKAPVPRTRAPRTRTRKPVAA